MELPNDYDIVKFDPQSKYYSRSKPRTLNLTRLLPYRIENAQDQINYLDHIVKHLYIAVGSSDIQGLLSVSPKDLDMSDSDSDSEEEFAIQHKKSPKLAPFVSVKSWTHELLVWMKMKYDMPMSTRIELARVYYAICLCRGQNVNLKFYVKVFEILTKDQPDLYKHGLRLDHKDLLHELLNLFPPVSTSVTNFERKDQKPLIRLASRASYFFDRNCLPHLYEKLGCHFSPVSSLVMSTFSILPNFFNQSADEHDIRFYIDSFFYMWKKLNKLQGFDAQVTSRLGVISMAALTENIAGEFGVYNKEQIDFLFNILLNSLSISKYSSFKLKYFHGFASAIIFSMVGESTVIIQHLKSLLNAIESYIHPTNTGEWTRPISKMVLAFTYQFHKRFNSENQPKESLYHISAKLSKSVVKQFVEIFLPVVKIGIQSKKDNATDDYITALQLLGLLEPEYVLENTLLDIYESLEGVISTHRVSIALRSISVLARSIVSTPVYRVHTTRLLSLALPGIDSNDLEKTIQTFEVFTSIANFAPFCELEDGEPTLALEFTQEHLEHLKRRIYKDDEFKVEKELEINALKSSTTAFKDIIKSLLQRLFLLFENLPDPEKSSGLEQDLSVALPRFLFIIFESMSDDLVKTLRDEFFDFIYNNTYHLVADTVADICGGIVKRDPKCFKKNASILIEKIKEEIEENGAGKSPEIVSKDHAFVWYMTILNECVGNAGSQVISKEITDFAFYIIDNVRGALSFQSHYISNILQTVTKVRLKECRLIVGEVSEESWGGHWDSEDRFNTSFEWFVPSEKDVSFAIDLFQQIVSKIINVELVVRPQILDDLKMYLLSLSYCLSGVAYLLDPNFPNDQPFNIYYTNYYFKEKSSLYHKIHDLRQSVGNKIHSVFEFLHQNFSDNTKILESFLQLIHVWFADVGKERALDPINANISYSYICYTQVINRVRKPYTRIAIGARLESYQNYRATLHATSRTETPLDRLLIEDLVQLSVSTYSTIAEVAQGTLIEVMKRVIGAYNTIVKSGFKHFDTTDPKKIESCLKLFCMRKIQLKLQVDMNFILAYVSHLHECFKIDNPKVQKFTNILYSGIKNIDLPSQVCIINFEICLQPEKEKKRAIYNETWEKLQDLVLNFRSSHWKTTLINLELLEHLQAYFQVQIKKECLNYLLKEAQNDHPIISRLALQGITRSMSKMLTLSAFDYDVRNAYDLYYKNEVKTVDTRPNPESYYETWKEEMKHPTYYVDLKPDVGWLFWGSSLDVVDLKNLRLKPEDIKALQLNIDKAWFSKIVKSWMADAEIHSSFQIPDVLITATLMLLINYKWIPLTIDDVFDIMEENYIFDEKSSHLVESELISGILVCTYLSQENRERCDEFISSFLTKAFADLSPDNSGVWTVFSLWNPSHVDFRRYPKIMNTMIDIKEESSFKEASRISYVRCMVSAISWRLGDPDKLLNMCLEKLNHKYLNVRTEIGNLMAVLSLIYYVDSLASSRSKPVMKDNAFTLTVPKILDQIESWRNPNLTPQEILNSNYIYTATTVLTWMRQQLNTNYCTMFENFIDLIIPFLFNLMNLKEVLQLGNIDPVTVLKKLSQIPFKNLETVVNVLEYHSDQELNYSQTMALGGFIETIFFKNLFNLSTNQRERIFKLCNDRLSHKLVEVRESAAETLSGLIHISSDIDPKQLSKFYIQNIDKIRKRKPYSNGDLIELHGAVLGLSALIHAFAFHSPPPKWIPEILTTLANKCTGLPGNIGKTAKESLSRFKKNRQDSWHIDSKVFNEEQIQDLEGVLWKSYFI